MFHGPDPENLEPSNFEFLNRRKALNGVQQLNGLNDFNGPQY
jgi:hypothetical protein